MIRRLGLLACFSTVLAACAGDESGSGDGGVGGAGGGGGAPGDGPMDVQGDVPPVKCGVGGACTLAHAMATCLGGTCQVTGCNAGYGDCNKQSGDGCEVDLAGDPANCSACGMACPGRMNATSTCKDGTCAFLCATGFGNCDDSPDDGCEADLRTDPANCGSCLAKCGTRPNATAACAMSMCAVKCIAGHDNCDGDLGNGCETPTAADPKNCGKCGMTCGAGDACIGGTCKTAPKALFYRVSQEKNFLPFGITIVVADATMWKSLGTADFASYALIVIGDDPAAPLAPDYAAAYETRALWTAAVTGRVVVTALDPTYHAGSSTPAIKAGATTFVKAALAWALGGSGTGLYVSSDWNSRGLDFLSAFGTFEEATGSPDKIHVTMPSHPAMAGSTDETLSAWATSGHAFITKIPPPFVSLASETSAPSHHVVLVRE